MGPSSWIVFVLTNAAGHPLPREGDYLPGVLQVLKECACPEIGSHDSTCRGSPNQEEVKVNEADATYPSMIEARGKVRIGGLPDLDATTRRSAFTVKYERLLGRMRPAPAVPPGRVPRNV